MKHYKKLKKRRKELLACEDDDSDAINEIDD